MSTNNPLEAERLALKVVIWPFLFTFFGSYFIFHSVDLPVKQLLGYDALILVAFSFLAFLFAYIRNLKNDKQLLSGALIGLLLAIIYAGATAMVAVTLTYLISQAYPGAHVIRLAVALTGAVAAVIGTYAGIRAALTTNAMSITKNLTIFLFGGLLLSALSETNPLWYTESFSYLGMTPSVAAQIFNFTMIFTGLGAIVLSFYLFRRFEEKIPDHAGYLKYEKYLKLMLWTMGAGIAIVGLIPYEPGIRGQIHTLGATLAGIFFFVLAVFASKLLPGMQKAYYWLSYLMAAIVAGTYVIFLLGKNTLATVEIIMFISVFVWIYITLKCVDLLDLKG